MGPGAGSASQAGSAARDTPEGSAGDAGGVAGARPETEASLKTAGVEGGSGRLAPTDWLAAVLLVGLVGCLFYPFLPPSICMGDFGDLQLAAAYLGIAHPPGYPIYASLLHLATWIPGVGDMRMVSVACLGFGLLFLAAGVLIQVRLGVSAWVAAAVCALLAVYTRVRLNLTAPEVYAPTLVFLAASILMVLRFERTGRRRDILIAAFLFGVAAVSRPPLVLAAPFFLAAWATARTPAGAGPRRLTCAGLIGLSAVLPAVYSVAYVLVRDVPGAGYNYIEHYNMDPQELPGVEEGLAARLGRVGWLMSGAQFTEYVAAGDGPGYWRKRLSWLKGELTPYGTGTLVVLGLLATAGLVSVFRRSRAAFWTLVGVVVQSVAFVVIYHMHGQAADVLPVLFVGAILCGVAVWRGIERWPWRARDGVAGSTYLAVGCFAAAGGWTIAETTRFDSAAPGWIDGSAVVEAVRIELLPENAVVLALWDESVPIRYAALTAPDRDDITVVTSPFARWPVLAERYADCPVFVSREVDLPGYRLRSAAPSRLWRLEKR